MYVLLFRVAYIVLDVIVGWLLESTLQPSVVDVMSNFLISLHAFWLTHRLFTANLLDSLLLDAEQMLVQDPTVGMAAFRCAACVVVGLLTHLQPTDTHMQAWLVTACARCCVQIAAAPIEDVTPLWHQVCPLGITRIAITLSYCNL